MKEVDDIDPSLEMQDLLEKRLASPDMSIDDLHEQPEDCSSMRWAYELLRQAVKELNYLLAHILKECTKDSCPKMQAGELEFLCASHKQPQECDAISYSIHTLDKACAALTSESEFQSRVMISDSVKGTVSTQARRVYRIFAHASLAHPDVFQQFEEKHRLCQRFHHFALKYELMTPDALIVKLES